MIRLGKVLLGLAVGLMCASTSQGFSLLGRGVGTTAPDALFPSWQTDDYDGLQLDYAFDGDIGGPMRVNEGYRWNLPVITYAFDQSFVNYFGAPGMRAVEEAIRTFSGLPPMNRITSDGFSLFVRGEIVPLNTTLVNQDAQALGLLDVKSTTMHLLIEQLGLAEPERYAWALGSREVVDFDDPIIDQTNYTVINLNFDPITLRPTNMVNGILYGYDIFEFNAEPDPDFAEALEVSLDPLATFPFTSVAGGRSVLTTLGISFLNFVDSNAGRLYTGLTHDDVGGLRWLYHPNNLAVENLNTNAVFGTAIAGRSPWQPFFVNTNFVGNTNALFNTNLLVREALRGGINKIRFQRVNYDSLLGNTFRPITNQWMDRFITNGQVTLQPVQRVINQPDIIFIADRLGLEDNFFPVLLRRSSTLNWENNDAINGQDSVAEGGGPGVIQPPVAISYSDQLPFFFNSTDFPVLFGVLPPPSEQTHIQSVTWASFDESSTPPIIYPLYRNITMRDLRRFAVGGGN